MAKQKRLTVEDFRIRASSASKIMGGNVGLSPSQKRDLKNFRTKQETKPLTPAEQKKFNLLLIEEQKEPELPQGAKTYVRQWVRENIIFARRKLFGNKYTRKGHKNEDAGRDLVANYLGLGWLPDANDNGRKYSEYIEGICDAELKDFLIDIKNSYTFDTFPIFEVDCPKEEYVSQMKCYCHLYKKSYGIIAFVLTDSDEDDIMGECRSQMNILGMEELTGELYDQVKSTMTYGDLPDKLKVKLFKIKEDPAFIKEIEERVKMCRKYAQKLIDDFKGSLSDQKNIIE